VPRGRAIPERPGKRASSSASGRVREARKPSCLQQKHVVPVLRHRLVLSYRAEAEGVRDEDVLRRVVAAVS
jgi:hypothetical protein